uniref:Uncharacterized protein n=1 Tax=Alexandrium monilatum TaxID=311494 RepID=A0A7S4VCH1_9DINO
MTLSRYGIGRRLFRIILTEKLQAGEVLKKPADLVFSEHLPALLQAVGKLQFEEEGDLKELNLGSDDTILDPETGKVFGLWNSVSRQLMPMTHMCNFYQVQGRAASPEAIAEQGEDVEQMALVVGREDLLQIGGHEDSVKAAFDDCMDKVAVGDEATMAGALVRCKQFASDCRFQTGLEVSEESSPRLRRLARLT